MPQQLYWLSYFLTLYGILFRETHASFINRQQAEPTSSSGPAEVSEAFKYRDENLEAFDICISGQTFGGTALSDIPVWDSLRKHCSEVLSILCTHYPPGRHI